MRRTWQALAVIAAVGAVVLGAAAASHQRQIVDPAQGPEVHGIMREKLTHAQMILEAVVTSDWASLETHSRELSRLTADPRWNALTYPEYARYSAAFRRAVDDLHDAAVRRDLERSPNAYVAVTLRCVDCHRYLARMRITTNTTTGALGRTGVGPS